MSRIQVFDAEDKALSPCSHAKAERLVAQGQAEWIQGMPEAIRLHRAVALPEPTAPEPHPLQGKRTLLHICCAPCATFTVDYLREQGAAVTGYWYNPNIHPFAEHERRRETLSRYAGEIGLEVEWEPGYEMPAFLRAVAGREVQGVRCALCYRMRLERTAQTAARLGMDAFTTTLLISPYQDLEAIRRMGQELAASYGVAFYGESLRKGFAEHHRLAREHDLYRQRYCGCLYSEWESLDPDAATRRHRG